MAEKKEDRKRNITVFGLETEFDGILEFSDNLVITGKFTGKINAPNGDLEIDKNATCTVENIDVNSVVVSGVVKGNINAKERVEICSGSVVESDIVTARLRIAKNVDYTGQITMLEKEPDVDLFSVASQEYKQSMVIHADVIK